MKKVIVLSGLLVVFSPLLASAQVTTYTSTTTTTTTTNTYTSSTTPATTTITFPVATTTNYKLTKAEVETIRPQLVSLFSAISSYLSYYQARINTDNALFTQFPRQLGSMSVRLSQAPTPSAQEVDSMRVRLAEMSRVMSMSLEWRAQADAARAGIINFLGNISTAISTAV